MYESLRPSYHPCFLLSLGGVIGNHNFHKCFISEPGSEMYQPEEEGDGHLNPDFGQMTTSIIDGLKSGSKWLVVDNTYICHMNSKSVDGKHIYWECSQRRRFGCPFKASLISFYHIFD